MRYRYSDGNTYTDNLTLAQARKFQRLQNGGIITRMPMTSHEMAEQLRSAASALEHGRYQTARKKVGAVAIQIGADGGLE